MERVPGDAEMNLNRRARQEPQEPQPDVMLERVGRP
jgi:hypothetical protein